jgi:hypothetical protein
MNRAWRATFFYEMVFVEGSDEVGSEWNGGVVFLQ